MSGTLHQVGMKAHKLSIIIIEDDDDVIDVVKYGIEQLAIRADIDVISNEGEFKKKFSSMKPDIVLLDLMMPGITGFQICSYLRKNPRLAKLKILAITGYDTPENKERILREGADDYLAKPFDLEVLIEKLQSFINQLHDE